MCGKRKSAGSLKGGGRNAVSMFPEEKNNLMQIEVLYWFSSVHQG